MSRSARVLLASAMALVGWACTEHPESRSPEDLPSVTVRIATVEPAGRTASEEIVGTVRSRLSARVEARISARVERFPATPGRRVQAGELLVELDSREIRARMDQAVAVLDQAESDLDRFETLLAQEAITRAEYDAVLARQRVAQAVLAEAETMLAHTTIVAPFDGIVVRKNADVGDLAAPGRPLVDLEDPSHLRLEAGVPEALVDRVPIGAVLPVRVGDLDLSGTVAEIAPSADSASRTFLVKLDLPAEPDLRAGLFGRVSIPVAEVAALRVPATSVQRRGQLEIVFVVENGRSWLRLIRTGKRTGDQVEVLSGVDAGETIVVEWASPLLDGQRVDVQS